MVLAAQAVPANAVIVLACPSAKDTPAMVLDLHSCKSVWTRSRIHYSSTEGSCTPARYIIRRFKKISWKLCKPPLSIVKTLWKRWARYFLTTPPKWPSLMFLLRQLGQCNWGRYHPVCQAQIIKSLFTVLDFCGLFFELVQAYRTLQRKRKPKKCMLSRSRL